MSHPPIAIAWKIQNNLFYPLTSCHLLSPLGWLDEDVLPGRVPGAIDAAPACRDDAEKGAAPPDMPAQSLHAAVEGELAQRFF